MSSFSEEEKAHVVRLLARWCGPSEVARLVSEEWGREVKREDVWRYSPNNPRTTDKWRELYAEEQARFIDHLAEQPLYHRAFRLAELMKLYESTRSPKLKADLLRQAAEEVGGRYTNERQVTGANGQPLMSSRLEAALLAERMTDEEAREILAQAARGPVDSTGRSR